MSVESVICQSIKKDSIRLSLKTFDSMMLASEVCDSLKVRFIEKNALLNKYIEKDELKDKELQKKESKARSLQAEIDLLKNKYKNFTNSKPFHLTAGFSANTKGEIYLSLNVGYSLFRF